MGVAYRACHFGGYFVGRSISRPFVFRVELLAGRIEPVISVVVYWVERIAPVRMWVWRNWCVVSVLVVLFYLSFGR